MDAYLLYADDGALLADTPDNLQQMLDALKLYCAKWRMHVNVKKTKIVVFNKMGAEWCHSFTYNEQRQQPIEIV